MALDDASRRYLASQARGRLATVGPDGAPQNKPVGFVYNAELGTIDIAGFDIGKLCQVPQRRGQSECRLRGRRRRLGGSGGYAVRRDPRPGWPAGEPFLKLINGGRPFAAVPYSVHLNDIASLVGEQGSSQSLRRRYDGGIS